MYVIQQLYKIIQKIYLQKKPAKKDITTEKKTKKHMTVEKGTTNESMYFLLQNRDFPGMYHPKQAPRVQPLTTSPTAVNQHPFGVCLFSGTSPRSTATFSKRLVSWSRTAMWASTPGEMVPKWWALEKVSPFKTWQFLVSIR